MFGARYALIGGVRSTPIWILPQARRRSY